MRKEQKYMNKTGRALLKSVALGDGYVDPKGYITILHSERQKEYLEWKMKLLRKNGISTGELKEKNNNGHKGFTLCVNSTEYGKLMRRFLYTPYKKPSPKFLSDLGPLGLAILYMDDGSISTNQRKSVLTISTCLPTKEDNQVYIDWIKKDFNVQFGQRKMGQNYALICGTREARKFIEVVKPFVNQVDCMKYKLNVKPEKAQKSDLDKE